MCCRNCADSPGHFYPTGTVLGDWLTANVIPIFKKNDRSNPSNYWPISLTSICSKVMEHVIYHSVMATT